MSDTKFITWSCGHSHQPDAEGRTLTCDDAKWYILEADEDCGYSDDTGLDMGDYTLHVQADDATYSPAQWGEATGRARDIAHGDERRLMVRSGGQWVEVP